MAGRRGSGAFRGAAGWRMGGPEMGIKAHPVASMDGRCDEDHGYRLEGCASLHEAAPGQSSLLAGPAPSSGRRESRPSPGTARCSGSPRPRTHARTVSNAWARAGPPQNPVEWAEVMVFVRASFSARRFFSSSSMAGHFPSSSKMLVCRSSQVALQLMSEADSAFMAASLASAAACSSRCLAAMTPWSARSAVSSACRRLSSVAFVNEAKVWLACSMSAWYFIRFAWEDWMTFCPSCSAALR
mmetsp:Transcript_116694/g.363383  ORF Transcript_116694/g.363383 Transcript_116694/m.363383 type:complete len:242 (-) Transcript_116694:1041-1766(-)